MPPDFVRYTVDFSEGQLQCCETGEGLTVFVDTWMGGLATADIRIDSWQEIPLCLIAPAFGFKQNMLDKIHGFDLYPQLFDELFA